jgi:hypothetical protein
MNFIEQIFHVSPDGGSGILELSITLAILTACLAAGWSRLQHRRRIRNSGFDTSDSPSAESQSISS